MFIVCVDGLKGFPQAIEAVYPQAQVQNCIVHMVRASLNYVNWKERKKVAADLKPVYRAATAEAAATALGEFAENWGGKYQAIVKLWRENWTRVIPFFAFPAEVRKVIYTTNAVESLHMSLRKVIKTRNSFPNEEAALKLLYLALRNASKNGRPCSTGRARSISPKSCGEIAYGRQWAMALNQTKTRSELTSGITRWSALHGQGAEHELQMTENVFTQNA
jgi:transposase-like protein